MEIQLLRHATLLVTINGKTLLVDPMLGRAGVMPPIVNSPNHHRNPLVEMSTLLDFQQGIDGVLLTHTHRDHLDEAAIEQIPRSMPLLCQPEDEEKLRELGFMEVSPIEEQYCWQGITINRTEGQHGTGEIATQMAPVSGYVLQVAGEPSLYIAGDTIFYPGVESVLTKYEPSLVVVNAGGARFNVGDPITMTAEDVTAVCVAAPAATVIAVHMEAINHCIVTREELRDHLMQQGVMGQVKIPLDGDTLRFL